MIRLPSVRGPGLASILAPPNPLQHAMANRHSGFRFLYSGRGRRCDLWVHAIVAVSLAVASGCGSGENALLP